MSIKNVMNSKKNIWAAIVLEVIILIVLGIVMVVRMSGNNITTLDLSKMQCECEGLVYDGDQWYIDKDTAEQYVRSAYLLSSEGIDLGRGTYTVVVDYSTSEIQKGVVEVESGVIDTVDYFMLSNNKTEAREDFRLSTDVQGLQFRLKVFYGGEFALKGITIIKNTHDLRMIFFVVVLLSLLLDIYMFSDKLQAHKKTIFIIAGIAMLASLPLFPEGIMTGNDIRFHLVRIESIAEGLKNGVFPVRMDSVFNDDYGYPVSVFYGDALLYIPAVLRIIGFSTLQSYKLYIFFTNILTAGISYYCGKKMFKKDMLAAIFAMVFSLSSYRMVCLYARASVGEYSATCFYPLVILAVYNIYTQDVKAKPYKKNAIILAVGMAGIIYSHVLSTEMMIITLLILALALCKRTFRKETLGVLAGAILLCLCISASFIVPFIEYYGGLDLMIKSSITSDYIQGNGAYLSDYFAVFKSITGGDYSNRRGIYTPGAVLMIGLVLGLFLIFTKRADARIKVTTVGGVVALFAASTVFPWNRMYEIPYIGPMLVTVQFQTRYIGIAACFLSVLLCLVIERITEAGLFDKRIYTYTIVTGLAMSLLFLSQYQDEMYVTGIFKSYDKADMYVLTRYDEFGMYIGAEYLLDDTNMSKEAFDYGVYGDDITAVIVGESGVRLQVSVVAEEGATLEVPRFAYPHFVVRDEEGNKLDWVRGHNNKIIVQFDQPYTGSIVIDFEEPWYWRLAEAVSLATIAVLVFLYIKNKKTRGIYDYEK